jgi:hypothetical protein
VNLALRLSANQAVVYRKPWGVIAFSCFLAVVLAAAAAGFGMIGYRDFTSAIGIPFMIIGSIFGTFALLTLLDIARKSGTWLRNGGVPLLTASRSGLGITTHYNVAPKTYDWTSVNAVILTDVLETVDTSDTDVTRAQLVVFLAPDAIPPTLIGKITAHIAKSGEGKPYIATDFQHRSARDLETALRQLAPAHVLIRRCKRAIFDRKTKTDTYETA